ncbi:MAG: hypothetical protein WBB01_23805 [Phormidesmis sp.]
MSTRDASIIGQREAHSMAHQEAMVITAALAKLDHIISTISKRSQERSRQAEQVKAQNRASIVAATERLIGRERNPEKQNDIVSVGEALKPEPKTVQPISERGSLSSIATPQETEEMAIAWNTARDALANKDSELSRKEMQEHAQKMKDIKERLGAANLTSALVSHTASKQLAKEDWEQGTPQAPESTRRSQSNQAVEGQQDLPLADQSSTRVYTSEEIARKHEVVSASDQLVDSSYEKQDAKRELKLEPSTLAYSAEEYNIYHNGSQTTITDKKGNTMFSYVRDGDNVTVTKDNITNDPSHVKDFEKANKAINDHGIKKLQDDCTRQLEAKELGGLAREGSRAVAITSMVTDRSNPVLSNDGYTYRRTTDGFFVEHADKDGAANGKIAASSTAHGLSTENYGSKERKYFKEKYNVVSYNVEKSKQEKEASQIAANVTREAGRPVKKHDTGAER